MRFIVKNSLRRARNDRVAACPFYKRQLREAILKKRPKQRQGPRADRVVIDMHQLL